MQPKSTMSSLRKRIPSGEERYVAYIFCGLLSFLIVSYVLHGKLEFSIVNVGEVFPRAVLFGILVYAFYRRILGELIYYPMQYLLTDFFWRLRRKQPELNSPLSYFRSKLSKKISTFELEDIQGIARDYLSLQGATHFWDGGRIELHILYLSATFGFFLTAAAAYMHDIILSAALALGSVAALLFAFIADSMQIRREMYVIRLYEKEIVPLVKRQLFDFPRESDASE